MSDDQNIQHADNMHLIVWIGEGPKRVAAAKIEIVYSPLLVSEEDVAETLDIAGEALGDRLADNLNAEQS